MKTLTMEERSEMVDLMLDLDGLRHQQYRADVAYAEGETTKEEWYEDKCRIEREMRRAYQRMHEIRG